MNAAILIAFLLAPAALEAAADTALTPAAARELGELERIFETGIPQALREDYSEEIVQAYMHGSEDVVTVIEECRALIARYRETGDARLASPEHGITLLHLACLARKPELVHALLAAGADPDRGAGIDRQLEHGEFRGTRWRLWDNSPLAACVRDDMPGMPPPDAATCRRIIDMLVAAGAEVRGEAGAAALLACAKCDFEGTEDLALHLLQLGADPHKDQSPGSVLATLANSGMPRLLDALLQAKLLDVNDDRCHVSMLGQLLENDSMDEGQQRACVALFLRHGADIHRPERPQLPYGATPSDLIHARPALLAWLKAQGFELPRTPRTFDAGLLTAPMKEDNIYTMERESALRLLWLTDAPRTFAAIQALPMWQQMDAPQWPATAGERSLFRALFAAHDVCLPADWLLEQAGKLDAAGHPAEAHELLVLLGRHDPAKVAPLVERLCRDERPSHAAAGWSMRQDFFRWFGVWPYEVQAWPNREDAARVTRLAAALSTLTSGGHRYTYLLDFSGANHGKLSFDIDIPSVIDDSPFWKSESHCCTPGEEAELVNTLRELGEPEAADFVRELFRLLHVYERGQATATDDDIGPDGDYEEPGNAAQERLTAFGSSPEATRHAFAIEAALGRLLWELCQKNTP